VIEIKHHSVHYGDMWLPWRQELLCTSQFINRCFQHGATKKFHPVEMLDQRLHALPQTRIGMSFQRSSTRSVRLSSVTLGHGCLLGSLLLELVSRDLLPQDVGNSTIACTLPEISEHSEFNGAEKSLRAPEAEAK
jgi:hypothetical protein